MFEQPDPKSSDPDNDSDHRSPQKSRPRPAWIVILFFATFFATVFVLAATLTSMHAPSLRSPAKLMAPSSSIQLNNTQSANQDKLPISVQSSAETPIKVDSQPTLPSSDSSPSHSFDSLHPPPDFPHACYYHQPGFHADGEDPFYPYNARTLCLTSSVCFQPATGDRASIYYPAAAKDQTRCVNSTMAFDELSSGVSDCEKVQSLVRCAQGRFVPPRTPDCPAVHPQSELSRAQLDAARWLDGIVFFVPAFPHMGNIFHFSYVAGAVGHIVSSIPKLVRQWRGEGVTLPNPIPVTVMIRGGSVSSFGGWQTGVLDLLINHRLKPSGFRIALATMNESVIKDHEGKLRSTELTCAKSAILLGERSHINLWPFPTQYWPDVEGNRVSIESVAFRRAAYDAVGLPSLVPEVHAGALTPPPPTAMFDLPPRSIGYSRRNIFPDPDPTSKRPYQRGTVRRFSDADEAWFNGMLQDVATKYNFSYVTLQTSKAVSFADQVKLYAGVGFVAGIHGANLMNAVFMRPFGGLMEIFAGGNPLQCYISGANAGLAYSGYMPVHEATPEESACRPTHPTCWTLDTARRVMVDRAEDREKLTTFVEEGAQRIEKLHAAFGHLGGIPAEYDVNLMEYKISWDKAKDGLTSAARP